MIISLLFLIQVIFSQDTQDGLPFTKINSIKTNLAVINLPEVNNQEMLEEDELRALGTPYRYGYKHEVHFSSENSGKWYPTDDGGKIWQISFKSESAYSICLEYEKFYIPVGGQLFVYSPDYEMVLGAYTHLNNSELQYFATPHIKGNTITLEYYQPEWVEDNFSILVTEIIHDYRDIMNFYNTERDWECGINVICEEREEYQGPINSVAFLDMGGSICSGAMVNNVRQDLTPYFLTAWHCTEGENTNIFRFYFEAEASSCENTGGSAGAYAYSSEQVASSIYEVENPLFTGGDWSILLINDEIEEEWNVYYAGWDATDEAPLISCGIHHPGGTAKKINYDDDLAYNDSWSGSPPYTHWTLTWDEGGSEGGSSGSPAFDEQFRIIGTLTAGSSGICDNPNDYYYGKMSYGWEGSFFPMGRKIDWLDPDLTGTLVLDGIYEAVTVVAGDTNFDGIVDILDIVRIVNQIMGNSEFNDDEFTAADFNADGIIDVLDIVQIVNYILTN